VRVFDFVSSEPLESAELSLSSSPEDELSSALEIEGSLSEDGWSSVEPDTASMDQPTSTSAATLERTLWRTNQLVEGAEDDVRVRTL
jgi:hypothetical protein